MCSHRRLVRFNKSRDPQICRTCTFEIKFQAIIRTTTWWLFRGDALSYWHRIWILKVPGLSWQVSVYRLTRRLVPAWKLTACWLSADCSLDRLLHCSPQLAVAVCCNNNRHVLQDRGDKHTDLTSEASSSQLWSRHVHSGSVKGACFLEEHDLASHVLVTRIWSTEVTYWRKGSWPDDFHNEFTPPVHIYIPVLGG